MVGEAAEPSMSVIFEYPTGPSFASIVFSQVTLCPALTFRVGGVSPPLGRRTISALSNMKSNVEFVSPFAVLAMISTGRTDEFTVGATEIPRSAGSWVPKKVNSMGLMVRVTPGTVDIAERVTWVAVVSSWLIIIE